MSNAVDRKARKPHHCSLCFRVIKQGETYKYLRVAPWDQSDCDIFWSYKAHAECDRLWAFISNDYDDLLPLDRFDWREMIEGVVLPAIGKGEG